MTGASVDIKKAGLEKLKALFPEVFSENELDWEKLKAVFGEDINFSNERYVLNWAGKSDAFKVLQTPTTATLHPMPEESINFDRAFDVFIEGENLEVLKVLQKSYHDKIKVIIIDPPYNTGNDKFIYPDKFSEKKEEYLKRIGDKDDNGNSVKDSLFRKNNKDNGHFHSNWLSMIYPRLFLAKNLLKDEGVIFVSIDDNEVHNLRLLMNEVFGEENFVANIPRITKKAGKTSDVIAKNHDYVLCYQKTDKAGLKQYALDDEEYKYEDEFADTRGKYKLTQTLDYGSIQYSRSLDYEIEIEGQVMRPGNVSPLEMAERKRRNPASDFCWRWSEELYKFGYQNGFVILKKSKGGFRIYTKTYENAVISKDATGYFVDVKKRSKSASTLDFVANKYSNDNSRKDLAKIFDTKVFDYSKPINLIKDLVYLSSEKNDIIMDFFAGSATTAQAVIEQNKADGGARKFILVQLPEIVDENSDAFDAGYQTIADISKERIRRILKKNDPEKTLFNEDRTSSGFRVFKLMPSNFKTWNGKDLNPGNLVTQLDVFAEPKKNNARSRIDLLYEILIKCGYQLTVDVVDRSSFYSINNNETIVIVDPINDNALQELISCNPKKVIAIDSVFAGNDTLKTNTSLQLSDTGIDFKTI